jgi:hypothetical protein
LPDEGQLQISVYTIKGSDFMEVVADPKSGAAVSLRARWPSVHPAKSLSRRSRRHYRRVAACCPSRAGHGAAKADRREQQTDNTALDIMVLLLSEATRFTHCIW